MLKFFAQLLVGAFVLGITSIPAFAAEGMWTFDNIPVKAIKQKYGFEPSQEWIDNVRLSSVRFNDGGSGSFITPTGLVITNHHVAVGQLQKMSSEKKDYVKDGFYASSAEKEVPCKDLELNVLVDMENVTSRVQASCNGLKGGDAVKARKAEIAKIEKEGLKKTGLLSQVVSLYGGGEYWLYSYKKYQDVRLVMAPEKQAAFFGGSSDNFTYPRYDLDYAVFRVYENGKPLENKNYMRMNPEGAKNGELVFITGHPGTTLRDLTYSQVLFNRDVKYPVRLDSIDSALKALYEYSAIGPEQKRRAATNIFYLENSKKALGSEYEGLKKAEFTDILKNKESELIKKIDADPKLKKDTGSAFEDVEKAMKLYGSRYEKIAYSYIVGYRLPKTAFSIVFYAMETVKPDGERINGYHDSQLETWKYVNFSPAPVYDDLEKAMLKCELEETLKKLGPDDPVVKIALDGKTPEARAEELISGTKLKSVEYRKQLAEGGMDAVRNSEDPLIKFALKLAPIVQSNIKWSEKNVESVLVPAKEKIAAAKFAVYGKSVYPDATFTLRLSYGEVKNYEMNGTFAPPYTTFYGLFDRWLGFGGEGDWTVPESIKKNASKINLSTPVNFVSDNDITGGNSGSPVVNAKGEVIGVVFDGNIESLPGRFVYDEKANRAVSVHAGGIIESMKNVYGAEKLVNEILGK